MNIQAGPKFTDAQIQEVRAAWQQQYGGEYPDAFIVKFLTFIDDYEALSDRQWDTTPDPTTPYDLSGEGNAVQPKE
jgi:hypothetical protein